MHKTTSLNTVYPLMQLAKKTAQKGAVEIKSPLRFI
jgi:hypothetical protein